MGSSNRALRVGPTAILEVLSRRSQLGWRSSKNSHSGRLVLVFNGAELSTGADRQ